MDLINLLIVGAPDPNAFVTAIRGFIGPIFVLALGLIALTFLMKRQITKFLQFFLIAVLVGAFFWNGEAIIRPFADWAATLFG
jgi:lipopolysaccharide export LptBFGC system permease protein LptF